ncbi:MULTISPECIES: TetR family transcriptional regulator [unclassified Streptomyces]|uniref:TetR family transcriptional regulator n=1 Tax=unclassified Streptomyces TaxID=2593676 RepID=UPI00371C0635
MVRQERALRTREKVLDAAAEEFAVQGYSRATLNAVAARTGMTKGALYGHFASKEVLACALLSQSHEVWEEIVLTRNTPGVTARTALETLVLDLARRLKADVRLRAALRLATDCPSLTRGLPDVSEDVRRGLVELVRRAQQEGSMPPRPPELVAQLLLAAMHGALHASFGPTGCTDASAWEAVWQLLLDALTGDPRTPPGDRGTEGGAHSR